MPQPKQTADPTKATVTRLPKGVDYVTTSDGTHFRKGVESDVNAEQLAEIQATPGVSVNEPEEPEPGAGSEPGETGEEKKS